MRTVIITGANAGIGYSAALRVAAAGQRVILVCRNQERAEQARSAIQNVTDNPEVHVELCDMSLMNDVARLAENCAGKYSTIDVLINNAADFDISRKKPSYTKEGLEAQFATNLLAPFLLTNRLLDSLKQSPDARIINIASKGLMMYPRLRFDFDNVDAHAAYNPAKVYYQTKLGLLMNSLYLRKLLVDTSVSVYAVRVTNVQIDISRYPDISSVQKAMYRMKSRFSISPDEMAKAYVALALGEKQNGFYFDENLREAKCNASAYDDAGQAKLWQMCVDLTERNTSAG